MQIKTLLLKSTHLDSFLSHGYGNGYIGIPKGHPWYGKDYDLIECEIHGGLTYSEDHAPKQAPDGYWWIGFDAAHSNDNAINCDKTYCETQVEYLRQQASMVT